VALSSSTSPHASKFDPTFECVDELRRGELPIIERDCSESAYEASSAVSSRTSRACCWLSWGAVEMRRQQCTMRPMRLEYTDLAAHGMNCGRKILSVPFGCTHSRDLLACQWDLMALQYEQTVPAMAEHWNLHDYCLIGLARGGSVRSSRQTKPSASSMARVFRTLAATFLRWRSQMPSNEIKHYPAEQALSIPMARMIAVSLNKRVFEV
jgi:hypothetical protein